MPFFVSLLCIVAAVASSSSCDDAQLARQCAMLCGGKEHVKSCPATCADVKKGGAMECHPPPSESWWQWAKKALTFEKNGKQPEPKKAAATTTSSSPLPVFQWPNNASPAAARAAVRELLRRRVPTLVRDVGYLAHAGFWRWSPTTMAQRSTSAVLHAKARRASPEFAVGCCATERVSLAEFWHAVGDADDAPYWYMAAPPASLGAAFVDDIPRDFEFVPASRGAAVLGADDDVLEHVWLASAQATTPLHYDPFENFFVQIYGTKRFTLLPPAYASTLLVHPKLHVRHRQVVPSVAARVAAQLARPPPLPHRFRVPTDGGAATEAAAAAHARYPLDVELAPGDILYVPSHWFHRVESTADASISLNRWYASATATRLGAAWDAAAVPIDPRWSAYQKTMAARAAVRHVARAVVAYAAADASDVVRALLKARYTALYGAAARANVSVFSGVESMSDPHCLVHQRELAALAHTARRVPADVDAARYCSAAAADVHGDARQLRDVVYGVGFKSAVDAVAAAFRAKPRAGEPTADAAIVTLLLYDLLEDMAGDVVGDENVYAFFDACFSERVEADDAFYDALRVVVVSNEGEEGSDERKLKEEL